MLSHPSRTVSFVMGMLVDGAQVPAAEVIFQHNFETNPTLAGWGSNKPPTNPWTTEKSNSPTHSIKAVDSIWFTPGFAVTPFQIYSLKFHSNTTGVGLFGHVEDVSSYYQTGAGWKADEWIFRINGNIPTF